MVFQYLLMIGGLEYEFYWNPNSWDDDPIWQTHIFQRVGIVYHQQVFHDLI